MADRELLSDTQTAVHLHSFVCYLAGHRRDISASTRDTNRTFWRFRIRGGARIGGQRRRFLLAHVNIRQPMLQRLIGSNRSSELLAHLNVLSGYG
jgi:hypothetical protein